MYKGLFKDEWPGHTHVGSSNACILSALTTTLLSVTVIQGHALSINKDRGIFAADFEIATVFLLAQGIDNPSMT